MPPDVFLILASSGLTLVAALMFFVSEEPEPAEAPVDPKTLVSFCLPPARKQRVSARPPPLPAAVECAVNVSTASIHGVMTLKPVGEEWVVTLDTAPVGDMPASQVHDEHDAYGAVHDLRWHGRAGVAKATTRTWKQKPGRA